MPRDRDEARAIVHFDVANSPVIGRQLCFDDDADACPARGYLGIGVEASDVGRDNRVNFAGAGTSAVVEVKRAKFIICAQHKANAIKGYFAMRPGVVCALNCFEARPGGGIGCARRAAVRLEWNLCPAAVNKQVSPAHPLQQCG